MAIKRLDVGAIPQFLKIPQKSLRKIVLLE
jgi:hypothetical protein